MKDKIFEYLRTNFADLGLSKEILGGYADLLAATITEEDGIAAAVETIKPLLILQQKENDKMRQKYAADNKDKKVKEEIDKVKIETDVKTEIRKNDGSKIGKGDDKKKDNEIPEYVKVLMTEIKDLKTSLKNKDRAIELGNRRKEINNIIGKLPKSLQKAYDRMDLDIPEDDFVALKESVNQEVIDAITEFSKKRAVFSPPFAGQGENSKTEISKDEADKIAKRLLNH